MLFLNQQAIQKIDQHIIQIAVEQAYQLSVENNIGQTLEF